MTLTLKGEQMVAKESTASKDAGKEPKVTAILSRKAEPQFTFVGIDDGHYGTKICLEDGKCLYMPSRAARGLHPIAGFSGNNEPQDTAYSVAEDNYTVIEDYALIPAEDTRYVNPPFPVSSLNRVLVYHALMRAGLGGKALSVVTGLPVGDFYERGVKNEELISAKIKNLLEGKIENKNSSIVLPKIVKHNVLSEGIAAFFDLLLNFDGSENEETVKLIERRAMAVVDVGGKTTDIALVTEGGQGIYPDRSGTKDVGALNLSEAVAAKLKTRFKLANLPPAKHVEMAIKEKTYSLYGDQHDIADIVDEEAKNFANKISSELNRLVRDGSDVGAVVFVGGGAIMLKPYFETLYPKQSIFPDQPEFANARGMLKAAKYILGND